MIFPIFCTMSLVFLPGQTQLEALTLEVLKNRDKINETRAKTNELNFKVNYSSEQIEIISQRILLIEEQIKQKSKDNQKNSDLNGLFEELKKSRELIGLVEENQKLRLQISNLQAHIKNTNQRKEQKVVTQILTCIEEDKILSLGVLMIKEKQLIASHPKLDLIVEKIRQKNNVFVSRPALKNANLSEIDVSGVSKKYHVGGLLFLNYDEEDEDISWVIYNDSTPDNNVLKLRRR